MKPCYWNQYSSCIQLLQTRGVMKDQSPYLWMFSVQNVWIWIKVFNRNGWDFLYFKRNVYDFPWGICHSSLYSCVHALLVCFSMCYCIEVYLIFSLSETPVTLYIERENLVASTSSTLTNTATAVLRRIHHLHYTCSVVVLWGFCPLMNRAKED